MIEYKIVKTEEYGLSFSSFSFSFLFFLSIYCFIFFIFRTLGLGLEVICHTVTSVTSDGVVTALIMGLGRRE